MLTNRDQEMAVRDTRDDTGMTVLSAIELPGTFQSVTEARHHVRKALGPGCDDVELAVTELVANAIAHSDSGKEGGQVTVALAAGHGRVRVAVTDAGSAVNHPRPSNRSADAEGGWGLEIIGEISAAWGVSTSAGATTVWCECPARAAAPR